MVTGKSNRNRVHAAGPGGLDSGHGILDDETAGR
jgi:hypothetical protein